MIQPEMKRIAGVISLRFDRNEIASQVINSHVNTTQNETIRKETSEHSFV